MSSIKENVQKEIDLDKFCEDINRMGHPVEKRRMTWLEPRDWDAEDVMNVWAGKYARNIALHYNDILESGHIGPLFGILKRIHPVAVVGAGPSLDKNAELLQDFPGLIIACDGAAIPLTARGIPPDLVVVVDPRQSVIARMIDYEENEHQTLALGVYTSPEVAAAWHGRKMYFSAAHPGTQFHDRILPELFPGMPALEVTGNVGNTAVQIAAVLGAGTIVLVGQDYGYSGNRFRCSPWEKIDGAWYVLNDKENDQALAHRSGKIIVDGVQTYPAFVSYRETLGQIIKIMKLDIINATEGGILNNVPAAKLADVLTDLRSKNHQAEVARAMLSKAIGGLS